VYVHVKVPAHAMSRARVLLLLPSAAQATPLVVDLPATTVCAVGVQHLLPCVVFRDRSGPLAGVRGSAASARVARAMHKWPEPQAV
jgi:hypothetical protein